MGPTAVGKMDTRTVAQTAPGRIGEWSRAVHQSIWIPLGAVPAGLGVPAEAQYCTCRRMGVSRFSRIARPISFSANSHFAFRQFAAKALERLGDGLEKFPKV